MSSLMISVVYRVGKPLYDDRDIKEPLETRRFYRFRLGSYRTVKKSGIGSNQKGSSPVCAFTAGLEMDMMSHAYDRHLQELVEEGKVSMAQVDEGCPSCLTSEIPSWLVRNVLIPLLQQRKERFFRPKSMDIAARLAAESMVVLKKRKQRFTTDR